MKFGLKESIVEKINNLLSGFPEVESVIIYGSRAKGNYKPGSDIDLTLKGNNLNLKILNNISMKLDDLLLPYTFDLSIFHQIDNKDLIEHINRIGNLFYEKKKF
ncbi:MAG: nucleotidyltransferase domain-containing protein [Bacteroidota bacterium]|nr:nucleotidyltransferase domain-containing protein [Bacteroidota bacterium]